MKVVVVFEVPDDCCEMKVDFCAEGEKEIKTGEYEFDSYGINMRAAAYDSLPYDFKDWIQGIYRGGFGASSFLVEIFSEKFPKTSLMILGFFLTARSLHATYM